MYISKTVLRTKNFHGGIKEANCNYCSLKCLIKVSNDLILELNSIGNALKKVFLALLGSAL